MLTTQAERAIHLKKMIDEKMKGFKSGVTQWGLWAHLFHADFKDGLVRALKEGAAGIDPTTPTALRDLSELVDRIAASNMRQSYDKHKIEDYGSLGERLDEILQAIWDIQQPRPVFPEIRRAVREIAVLSKRALEAYHAANAERMALI